MTINRDSTTSAPSIKYIDKAPDKVGGFVAQRGRTALPELLAPAGSPKALAAAIAAGADAGAYAQLITDGVHIHPSVVRLLYKLYGADRITIISDSMQATAVGDGEYVFGGLEIVVKDGVARTMGGNLAGSTTCLFDCVRCAIKMGIPEEDAVKMGSTTPAALMGLNKGRIEVGYDADFIIVDDEFNLVRAIARGEW